MTSQPTASSTAAWMPAIGALFLALFFWALIPLFLEAFTHWLDPWTVNGIRYFFAAAFWLPFVIRDLRRLPAADRRALCRATLPLALTHMACQICYGLAPYYNNATLLNFGCRLSIPFTTLFGFWLLQRERPLARKPAFWTGLAFALGGFFLMFEQGFGTDSTSKPGMSLLLGYAILWGLYVVLVRRNLSAWPAHLSYGLISIWASVLMLLLMTLFGRPQVLLHLPISQWGLLFLSAMIGLAWSHVLYYRAIRVIGPIASEGGMLLIPFQTALMAHLLFGEHLRPVQWAAGLLLLLGCALLLTARYLVHRERPHPAPYRKQNASSKPALREPSRHSILRL